MSHTPGPWRIQADPEWKGLHPLHDNRFITTFDFDIETDVDTGGQIIAKMTDCQNQAENARLIASAPDAYELALHILAMEDDAYLMGHPEWVEICREARTLIRNVGEEK